MRRCWRAVAVTVLVGSVLQAAPAQAVTVLAPRPGVPVTGAPYWYLGWGSPPDPVEIMHKTKVKAFTEAFVLSKTKDTCDPSWDGLRPLDNPNDINHANGIRAAGGDIVPSMGGGTGQKLGETCTTREALAAAYQKVIDLYRLRAIDVDIEEAEFRDPAATQRQMGAIALLKKKNPRLRVFVTIPVLQSGLSGNGDRLIDEAVQLGADIDVWTAMPFYFGGAGADMGELTVKAMEGMHGQLKKHYPKLTDKQIYAKTGISSMAGITGDKETITPANLARMRDYANKNGLGRFTFWSANRDRPCTSSSEPDSCSEISQQPWDFSKVVGGFHAS